MISTPKAPFSVSLRRTRFSANSTVNPSVAVADAESHCCSKKSEKVHDGWRGAVKQNKTLTRRTEFASDEKPNGNVVK